MRARVCHSPQNPTGRLSSAAPPWPWVLSRLPPPSGRVGILEGNPRASRDSSKRDGLLLCWLPSLLYHHLAGPLPFPSSSIWSRLHHQLLTIETQQWGTTHTPSMQLRQASSSHDALVYHFAVIDMLTPSYYHVTPENIARLTTIPGPFWN